MPGIALTGEDYAKNPGLSVTALASFLRDIDFQPSWRARADVDADYYDSNQYDSQTLALMEERGIPPIVVNLIAPTINLVLGMEEKTRRDWVVRADDDKDVDFALAMSQKMQEAERGSFADKACSDAFAGQTKAGLHWVHVRKQRRDPYAYPYVVEGVHRREIWWDWHDQDPLLRNARWLVRRKWYDQDVLQAQFPQHSDLIAQVATGWSMFEDRTVLDVGHPLYQDWLSQRDFHWGIDEWRNLDRKRLALYEVWYRVWGAEQPLLVLNDGRIFEITDTMDDLRKQATAEAIKTGMGEVRYARAPKMRLSYWIGPHRMEDIPSPMPHNDFPYVPFWGYREDRTGVPYGHIRAMRPMQDEVNARRARMLWQLSAKRLIGLEDAVRDKKAIEAEVARPDAAIWLNSKLVGNRTIKDILQIDDNSGLNAQQIAAYEDAKVTLQDVANTFKEQLGKTGTADSGIAISQLIEQGTMALAELNSNYQFARTAVGNQLFAIVKADLVKRETEVTIDKGMGQKKKVKINERKWDPELERQVTSNSVELMRAKVVIDDAPASATYRQHMAMELTNLAKGLPNPQLQAAVLDMVIMASDLPHREEIAARVRSSLGIEDTNVEAMSPEEQQAYAEKMEAREMMEKLREEMALLAKERADLENRKLDAETELTEAKTVVEKAKVGEMAAGVEQTKEETERLKKEPIVDKSPVNPGIDPKKQNLRDVA